MKSRVIVPFKKLGRGGVQGQGKGLQLMGIKAEVMTTVGWQHAKVKSTKSNPPVLLGSKMFWHFLQNQPKCLYGYPL